jgi:hypothetical protein
VWAWWRPCGTRSDFFELPGAYAPGLTYDAASRLDFDGAGFDVSVEIFLSPLRGWFVSPLAYPRLTPWAAFLRRFAAAL